MVAVVLLAGIVWACKEAGSAVACSMLLAAVAAAVGPLGWFGLCTEEMEKAVVAAGPAVREWWRRLGTAAGQ